MKVAGEDPIALIPVDIVELPIVDVPLPIVGVPVHVDRITGNSFRMRDLLNHRPSNVLGTESYLGHKSPPATHTNYQDFSETIFHTLHATVITQILAKDHLKTPASKP